VQEPVGRSRPSCELEVSLRTEPHPS
jgi:hypothetical protein